MKYLSRQTALDTAKQIFSLTSGDSVTPKEAALAWGGRENISEEKNRHWLDNKMIHMKYHNLIKPVYSRRNSRRVLAKIQLTLEGKRALGKLEGTIELNKSNGVNSTTEVSLDEIMKIISKLRQNNPEYQIIFDIRLKEN